MDPPESWLWCDLRSCDVDLLGKFAGAFANLEAWYQAHTNEILQLSEPQPPHWVIDFVSSKSVEVWMSSRVPAMSMILDANLTLASKNMQEKLKSTPMAMLNSSSLLTSEEMQATLEKSPSLGKDVTELTKMREVGKELRSATGGSIEKNNTRTNKFSNKTNRRKNRWQHRPITPKL